MNFSEPITSKAQLMRHLESGCKDELSWFIGTEIEEFIFQIPELRRAPYEGPRGIEALLTAFQRNGWQPILEQGHVIALKKNDAFITLEPAGQFELSTAKLRNLHEISSELRSYHAELLKHLKDLGLALLSQGMDPKTKRKDMPWMPKQRYAIMREYMPKKGRLGLDMMTATASVQVNLDYSSEQDCGKKFRVSMALQPLVTALFANSPLHEGKLTGFKSTRGHIWMDTDPDRSGLLPFAFEDNFTFEKYVDYALSVPMYFFYRDGIYHNHAGQSFKDYMKGALPGRMGELPVMKDFEDHLTTAFPEVRIKQYLEMRAADNGPLPHMEALSAFWTGLFYDQETLDEIYDMTLPWAYEDCMELQKRAIQSGLQTSFKGQPLDELARRVVNLACKGLKRRGCMNAQGQDESIYLVYLQELIDNKECPADGLIHAFVHTYHENVDAYLRGYLEP